MWSCCAVVTIVLNILTDSVHSKPWGKRLLLSPVESVGLIYNHTHIGIWKRNHACDVALSSNAINLNFQDFAKHRNFFPPLSARTRTLNHFCICTHIWTQYHCTLAQIWHKMNYYSITVEYSDTCGVWLILLCNFYFVIGLLATLRRNHAT